jgi:hypothetical protein
VSVRENKQKLSNKLVLISKLLNEIMRLEMIRLNIKTFSLFLCTFGAG